MRKSKFTESQIVGILGEGESGLPEMTSETFTEWAKQKEIALLFALPGKPNQNALFERFNRSFMDEVLEANFGLDPVIQYHRYV